MEGGPNRSQPGQARVIATGTLVQQLTQVTGLLAMLAIVTVLARRLDLTEFGVYGLLTSLAGYLLVVQNAAASAGVRTMAAATDDAGRTAGFSTAAVVYALAGAATGVVVAIVGTVIAVAVGLPDSLERQALLGAVLLGVVTAVGWPITVYRDALRARQLFVPAASIEMAALVAYAAVMLALAFSDVPLSVLIGANGSIPLFAGLGSVLLARRRALPFRFRRDAVTRSALREFGSLAGYVSLTEIAGTLIYALDRIILGLFTSAATVGLYEGPVRAHNVIRSLNAATTVTVLPTASRYVGAGENERLAQLLVRGVRYTLALSVPLTVVGMVLAPQILAVWLGEEFRQGGTAMAILMSYWLVNGCTGVLSGLLVAAGRARSLATYAWAVALANLVMSLALTPWLGLEGVVIGTAVPYLAAFPFLLRIVLREVPVPVARLARESFLPAYLLGLALAGTLAAARVIAEPDELLPVLGIAIAGVLAYWLAYYAVVLRPSERTLVRDVAAGLVPARSR
jgi:O-antigen/teichoic acid export membrane protein